MSAGETKKSVLFFSAVNFPEKEMQCLGIRAMMHPCIWAYFLACASDIFFYISFTVEHEIFISEDHVMFHIVTTHHQCVVGMLNTLL